MLPYETCRVTHVSRFIDNKCTSLSEAVISCNAYALASRVPSNGRLVSYGQANKQVIDTGKLRTLFRSKKRESEKREMEITKLSEWDDREARPSTEITYCNHPVVPLGFWKSSRKLGKWRNDHRDGGVVHGVAAARIPVPADGRRAHQPLPPPQDQRPSFRGPSHPRNRRL